MTPALPSGAAALCRCPAPGCGAIFVWRPGDRCPRCDAELEPKTSTSEADHVPLR